MRHEPDTESPSTDQTPHRVKHSRLCREIEACSKGTHNGGCSEPFCAIEQAPDWWGQQPSASLDSGHTEQRPSRPLATALSCRLCNDLLKEATTCFECGHTFCYDCILERIVIGGDHNLCPVPKCGVLLGPQPFEHHKIKYDFMLDGIVSKVFPRPALDAALQARRQQREKDSRLLGLTNK